MFHKILLNILLMLAAASLAAPSAVFAVQNCVMPPDGMVGWWPGDGNANDIVGGDNGILQGGAAFGTGIVGQAFQLDGIDSVKYIEVPDSQSLDISTAITIQAWVYINKFPTDPPVDAHHYNMQVFQKSGNQTYHAYALPILGDAGVFAGDGTLQARKFGLELTVNGQWSSGMWSNTELQEQTWYHLTAIYDGSEVKLYLNGQLDASYPLTGEIEINDKPAAIGAYGFNPFTSGWVQDYFNGTIDEVQIFDRALSASEIAAAYNAGSEGNCKVSTPLVAADCKKGSWQALTRADYSPFKNQGDCIQYVNTGK